METTTNQNSKSDNFNEIEFSLNSCSWEVGSQIAPSCSPDNNEQNEEN
jgi:hypothetical protein